MNFHYHMVTGDRAYYKFTENMALSMVVESKNAVLNCY